MAGESNNERPTRVVELGGDPAAAFCGKLFARWGAEVIRVEDALRPPDDSPAAVALDRYLNRGKRRVAIDWITASGRDLLDRLVARSDILITDLSPSALDDVQWESLGAANPSLSRCAITPFGLTGPYRDWQATPATLLALGGYTFIMGDPGRAPLTMPGRYAEYQAGTLAYTASLACRISADTASRTIDISMVETVATLSQFTIVMWTHGGAVRGRNGNRWANLHPITLYPCKDGHWYPNAVPAFWEAFTFLIDRHDLFEDERFATSDARIDNWAELDAIAVEAVKHKTMAELLDEGQETWRIPVGVVLHLQDALAEEHLATRDFWQDSVGGIKLPASPFRYVGEPLPQEPPHSVGGDDGAALLADLEGVR